MKLFKYLFGCFLFFASTSYAQQESYEISPKEAITKKYSLNPFTSVKSNILGKLEIKKGENCKVEATGSFETVELLYITSEDGVLNISIKKDKLSTKNLRNTKLTVTITAPTLSEVTNQGVSNLVFEGAFYSEGLVLESKGVGNIHADSLMTKELTIVSEGVGNIKVKGSSEIASYHSKGVGSIDAKGVKAKSVIVEQKGVGSISCYAAEELKVDSKGIGSVTYYGSPSKKDINKKGIGSITDK